MIRKSARLVFHFVTFGLLSLTLSMLSIFLWVYAEPRSLPFLSDVLEKSLARMVPGYQVEIGNHVLKINPETHLMQLHVEQVKIETVDGHEIANFPEILLDYSLIGLLYGDVSPSQLTVVKPVFWLDVSTLSSPSLSSTQTSAPAVAVETAHVNEAVDNPAAPVAPPNVEEASSSPEASAPAEDQNTKSNENDVLALYHALFGDTLTSSAANYLIPLKHLSVKDAELHIHNHNTDTVWNIGQAYVFEERKKGRRTLSIGMDVRFESIASSLRASVVPNEDGSLQMPVKITDFPISALLPIFPNLAWLEQLNSTINATLDARLTSALAVETMDFEFEKTRGDVNLPMWFSEPIVLSELTASGRYTAEGSMISLRQLEGLMNEKMRVSASGTIAFPQGIALPLKPVTEATFIVEDLNVQELTRYWPIHLAHPAREWVIQHIPSARIPKLVGEFKIEEKDWESDRLPDTALRTTLWFEELECNYYAPYPPLKNAAGTLHVGLDSLAIEVDKASMLSSALNAVKIEIDNFHQWPPVLSIEGDVTGSVNDALSFLDQVHKDDLKKEGIDLSGLRGNATTHALVTIPLHAAVEAHEVYVIASSHLTEGVLPKFLGKYDLSAADAYLSVAPNKVELTGTAQLHGSPFKFQTTYYVMPHEGELRYHVEGVMAAERLAEFGFSALSWIQHSVGVTIDGVKHGGAHALRGAIDFTQAAFTLPTFEFKKEVNASSALNFSGQFDPEHFLKIDSFTWQGKQHHLQGSAYFAAPNFSLTSLTLEKAGIGKNDVTIRYEEKDSVDSIDIRGALFDASNVAFGKLFSSSEGEPRGFKISLDLANLMLKNNQRFKEVKAEVNCLPAKCINIQLSADEGNGRRIKASLPANAKEPEVFSLYADDAATLIHALDISNTIEDGTLSLRATQSTVRGKMMFSGVLRMSDFRVLKASILARILTLASFTGISDLLEGEGVRFKQFEAPFTMHSGIITVEKAKSSGSSIGITADGTIDLNKATIDLHGTLIPANVINSIVNSIPVVGSVISGGKNQSLIATTYKVEGAYENAQISVNPLSLLTPGFLRNILDVFSLSPENKTPENSNSAQ